MNGTRMNQFVAPTSFMTDTSRRRAKIAMRIVLRMSTPAETMSTRAIDQEDGLEDVDRRLDLVDRRHRRDRREDARVAG